MSLSILGVVVQNPPFPRPLGGSRTTLPRAPSEGRRRRPVSRGSAAAALVDGGAPGTGPAGYGGVWGGSMSAVRLWRVGTAVRAAVCGAAAGVGGLRGAGAPGLCCVPGAGLFGGRAVQPAVPPRSVHRPTLPSPLQHFFCCLFFIIFFSLAFRQRCLTSKRLFTRTKVVTSKTLCPEVPLCVCAEQKSSSDAAGSRYRRASCFSSSSLPCAKPASCSACCAALCASQPGAAGCWTARRYIVTSCLYGGCCSSTAAGERRVWGRWAFLHTCRVRLAVSLVWLLNIPSYCHKGHKRSEGTPSCNMLRTLSVYPYATGFFSVSLICKLLSSSLLSPEENKFWNEKGVVQWLLCFVWWNRGETTWKITPHLNVFEHWILRCLHACFCVCDLSFGLRVTDKCEM